MLDYPSPVIALDYPGGQGEQKVLIPQNEVFRAKSIFEQHEYGIPAQYIPSGPLTIVDIGANVGLFALYMQQRVANSDIYCFEPAPQTMALLKKNTAAYSRIKVFPYALSDRDGTADLLLHPLNSGENSLKYGGQQSIQSVRVDVKCAVTAFHNIGLNYIDILKIDTEGCEVEILNSIGPYLPYVGIVMAEYHSDNDRRSIDAVLTGHLLFGAKAYTPQLGVVKYINARLL